MRIPSSIIWPIIFIGQLLAASLLAWHLMAQINFAYSTGYKMLDMDKHIAEFAPLNRYKHQFEFTTPQEHWQLFAQITDAVQHNGKGLAEISYKLPNGSSTPLMHSAEITHLQDVSHLISKFYITGCIGTFLWAVFLFLAYRLKLAFPSLRNIFLGFSVGIFVITTIILTIGATKVFYWFHTQIFPEGHQWFFYYEDSLMTTLMKAPDIFAFIALLLVSVLIIILALTTFGMARLLKNNRSISIEKSQTDNKNNKTTTSNKTKARTKTKK